jgi:hypothetical protein
MPARPSSFARRDFLRTVAGATAFALAPRGRAQPASAALDRYGGLKALRFEATGFFRLERRDRWWFVTPEGHAWLGFGLNHVAPAWLNQPYCAALWLRRFGAQRFDDDAWRAGLRTLVRENMAACGFNHLGVHNHRATVRGLGHPEIPAVEFVRNPHYRAVTDADMHDVFAPEFAAHCAAVAEKEIAPRAADPWVVGWAFTDCPIFTDAEAAARPVVTHGSARPLTPTYPRFLRNLPGTAPGKRAWLETIRARYAGDLGAFNGCYGVSFASWDALLAATGWRTLTDFANARELADNRAFLAQVVERYYATVVAAVRRHAPRHLIFGDKLNGNTDGADTVVALTARHTDVVFYQMYDRWPGQRAALDRWHAASGKPAFNGDGTFASPNPQMPNPHGPHARDQAERGAWAFEFGRAAFARPDFVGWTVCGWVDTWTAMRGKEDKQHSGFFTPLGEVHEPYVARLREVSQRLYDFARSP